jgi:hypothetical protein
MRAIVVYYIGLPIEILAEAPVPDRLNPGFLPE